MKQRNLRLAGWLLTIGAMWTVGCTMMPGEATQIYAETNRTRQELAQLQVDQKEAFRQLSYDLGQVAERQSRQEEMLRTSLEDLERRLGRIEEDLRQLTNPSAARIGTVSPDNPAESDGWPQPTPATPPAEMGATLAEPSNILLDAREQFARGDYDAAIANYRQFLNDSPDSPEAPEAAFRLASSLFYQKKYADAHAAFDEVIQNYPNDPIVPKALHSRALAEIRLDQLADARATLEQLRLNWPDYEPETVEEILRNLP